MYSAARSSPRQGVPRPSSRSDAMKERCPRSESAEMRSSTARVCGSSGGCGTGLRCAISNPAHKTKTGILARPLFTNDLMRQVPVRLLLTDLFVGVLHLGG